jgi:hypothetical protein
VATLLAARHVQECILDIQGAFIFAIQGGCIIDRQARFTILLVRCVI